MAKFDDELRHAFDTDREGALAAVTMSCETHEPIRRGLRARAIKTLDVDKVTRCLEGFLPLSDCWAVSACLRSLGARYSIPACGASSLLVLEYIAAYKTVLWRSFADRIMARGTLKRKRIEG